jgi:putative phage-type endonuclease
MEQNTKEWHLWRRKGLGASDTPIILGLSPFMTQFELWEVKTGRKEIKDAGPQAARGHALEPIARDFYEQKTGFKAPPKLVTMDEVDYMKASLDGFVDNERIVVEIKCPSKENHDLAKVGKVPEMYYWQMQHQMLVAKALKGHYVSFDGEEIFIVLVEPCKKDQAKLLSACSEFWEYVKNDKPPPLSDKDWLKIDDEKKLELADKWVVIKNKLDDLKKALDETKEELLKDLPHSRVICGSLKIQKVIRKGAVDYKSIPELMNVDVDNFRKPDSESWRITENKI